MTTHHKQNSGMCVPCSVRPTLDKGLGVFVDATVPRGSTIWRHVPGYYEVLDEGLFSSMLAEVSDEDAIYLLTHITSIEEFPGYMVRNLDEGALINHSAQPNVQRKYSAEDYQCPPVNSAADVSSALNNTHFDLIAAHDIAVGDELLMDYNLEPDDPDYYDDACKRYGVTWDWL